MAISFIQKQKKQKYLSFVLIAIIVIMGFVVWFGYFQTSQPKLLSGTAQTKVIKKIEIDFSVLKSPILKILEPFDEIGSYQAATSAEYALPEKVGRDNPFIPF